MSTTTTSELGEPDITPERTPARVLTIAAVAGAVGVLVATARYGMGLTPDSVAYLVGARNIADGRGFTDLDGSAITHFAPGYSAVLSAGERLGIDALEGARWLSAFALMATVWLGYLLLRRHLRSLGVVAAGTTMIACSAVLLEVYSTVLSEHLFVPVVMAFILVCEELAARPRSVGMLAAAVVLTWTAFSLRYAGIILVALGGATVLAAGWRGGVPDAVTRSALFGVASASAPLLWALRNRGATGDALGSRAPAAASPTENVRRAANELSQWVATGVASPAIRVIVLASMLGMIVVTAVWYVRRWGAPPDDWRSMLPLAAFVVLYVSYLVGSASVVAFAAIGTRFMLPAFVPLVIIGSWFFERVRDGIDRRALRSAITVVGMAFVVVNVAWFGGRAVSSAREGAGGYATERWQESELMDDVADLDLTMPTYANVPRAVALFLDEPVRQSPRRTRFGSDEQTEDLRRFVRAAECDGPVWLIWFEPGFDLHLYQPSDLPAEVDLMAIVERDDGTIYKVMPRQPTRDC